ncbi:hypothetical protein SLEP1_g28152 [Rubroshorea leprosula]|uniref:Uncharacterized protein n=1 Tax=Rubroshorea leprosula TaxID=152421 RepID=A0AAV5JYT5_9ROSI|nr:hypothetical protein SLEP1_g28152 [Rubroshorea leprosula]
MGPMTYLAVDDRVKNKLVLLVVVFVKMEAIIHVGNVNSKRLEVMDPMTPMMKLNNPSCTSHGEFQVDSKASNMLATRRNVAENKAILPISLVFG